MNRQLLTKWSNLTKVILAVLIIINTNEKVKANIGNNLHHASDSCANAKTENIDVRLLKSTSDYYIISVTTNNSSVGYSLSFTNGQNDVLYTTDLNINQTAKRYAITKTEDFEGLKIVLSNNKCNLSTTYDLSFVTKVTDQLLVSKK